MLGKKLGLQTALADGTLHPRSGIVMAATADDADGSFARNRLTVRPWIGLLSHTRRSRVWQEQTLVQIIESVFARYASRAQWRWTADMAAHLAQSPRLEAYDPAVTHAGINNLPKAVAARAAPAIGPRRRVPPRLRPTTTLELVELQAGRSFATAGFISERGPHPGRAVGPACHPASACDAHAFARDLLVVEKRTAQCVEGFAACLSALVRAVGLEHRAALEPRDQGAGVFRLQLHRQQRYPVFRHRRRKPVVRWRTRIGGRGGARRRRLVGQ